MFFIEKGKNIYTKLYLYPCRLRLLCPKTEFEKLNLVGEEEDSIRLRKENDDMRFRFVL